MAFPGKARLKFSFLFLFFRVNCLLPIFPSQTYLFDSHFIITYPIKIKLCLFNTSHPTPVAPLPFPKKLKASLVPPSILAPSSVYRSLKFGSPVSYAPLESNHSCPSQLHPPSWFGWENSLPLMGFSTFAPVPPRAPYFLTNMGVTLLSQANINGQVWVLPKKRDTIRKMWNQISQDIRYQVTR